MMVMDRIIWSKFMFDLTVDELETVVGGGSSGPLARELQSLMQINVERPLVPVELAKPQF